jgi:Ca2+-binding EF-hand superfamily protein
MRRMISEVDQNADNKIDLSEFKRMITLMAG